jgi:hypothetical protein
LTCSNADLSRSIIGGVTGTEREPSNGRSDALIAQNRIEDEVVLSPAFIEKLKEILMVVRPFVHWYVAANFRSGPIGLIARHGSLNDMMTIQEPDEESSEDGDDDGDAEEDEDE